MTEKKAKDATHRNAETAQAALNEPATQSALAVADATGAGGVPAVAGAAPAPAPDEHHGKGGLYKMVDGKRVFVEATDAKPTVDTAAP